MSAPLSAHPKILQMGKIDVLFDGEIVVEEKIDGSQFAFGISDDNELVMRSKGRQVFPETADKLFGNTIAAVTAREEKIRKCLAPGERLYGEALHAPRHNTLEYDRVPQGHLVLFGGRTAAGGWMSRHSLELLADELGFDVTPVLHSATLQSGPNLETLTKLNEMVEGPSFLGGKREGIVIKNYGQQVIFNGHPQPAFCKMVSDGFKEKHNENWTAGKDKLALLLEGYRSEARWRKTIERLRDNGELTGSVKDIGPLMRALHMDVAEEELDELGKKLAAHYLPQVKRIAGHGFPEFYKASLLEAGVAELVSA